jgi:hypothetical protein
LRKVTGKARVERMQRVSSMLSMRLAGHTLQEIGDAQSPKITMQAVHKAIKTALQDVVIEPLEQVRQMELLRLDELLGAIWPNAKSGDIAAVDRVLAISTRRARLMGLDTRPAVYAGFDTDDDPPKVRLEIVNNPEIERVRWLEEERTRLLALTDENARSVN